MSDELRIKLNADALALADRVGEILASDPDAAFEVLKICMYRRGYIGMVWLDYADLENEREPYYPGVPLLPRDCDMDQLTWETHAVQVLEQPPEWWVDPLRRVYELTDWPDSASEWLSELRMALWVEGVKKLVKEGASS